MKLIVIICMVALIQVSAASFAQKINLDVDKAPFEKVLNELSKQSGYHFLYDIELIGKANPVTLKISNATLTQVMDKCFANQPFTFVFDGKDVIIKAKKLEYAHEAEVPILISGTVTNEKNAPMPGVTVRIKGTQTVVATQTDGSYKIQVPDAKSILVFTFVGYGQQEMSVANKTVLNVKLKEYNTGLDDVAVIGYGQVKKRDLTGSVGSVNVQDLQKAPVPSFDQALAGRVAGVQVTNTDGQPGQQGINIVIRGNNSLTGVNTPLYVIDGFPIESPDPNSINPAEIESIDILKDASATAVYGSRGANGVVIITTKRGKIGPPVINYNGYYGASKVTKKMDLLSAYEFVRLQVENNAARTEAEYFFGGRTIDTYKDFQQIDWQDELFQTAPYQNHYLSLSGGNLKTKYTLSGSYFDQTGVFIASGYKRGQGRFTLDQQINDKVKVGINTNYASGDRTGTLPRTQTSRGNSGNSEQANLLYNTWIYRPLSGNSDPNSFVTDLLDPDADTGDFRINPLISARNEYNRDVTNTLSLNGYLDYAITKSLKLRITGGANLYANRNEIFNNTNTRSGSPLTVQGKATGINGSVINSQLNDFVNENSLTYTKNFNKNHQLTALGVFSLQQNRTRTYGYGAGLLPNEALGISGLDQGAATILNSSTSEFTMLSYTARVNYTLFNRYLFTVTFRSDGSSKFANGHKMSYFPSGAFAWRVSDEAFMKNQKAISNLKLRATYGVTGNNRVSDFGYLSQIGTNNSSGYYFMGNVLGQAFFPTNLGNPDLRWESTGMFDLGLDVGFLKDRISLVVDYYKKQTYDLLLNSNLAPSTGFNNSVINIGKTSNQGLEMTLSSTNVTNKDFKWVTNFNIAFNKNRVVSLAKGEISRFSTVPAFSQNWNNPSAYITKVGNPIAQFYGFVFDGVYQYSDFNRLPNGTFTLKSDLPTTGGLIGTAARQPGDAKYRDLNGDGIVNDADQTGLGNPTPIHTGGFSNNITYRHFDLSILFQWSYGNSILNANRIYLEGGGNGTLGYGVNQMASFADRWTPTNPNNTVPKLNSQGILGVWSSRYIEDASYLRLKTVSLGYNIPDGLLKKIHTKSARLYVSGQNLYTWTKYTGMDPEASVKGFGLTPAFDFSAYPNTRTLIVGLNVSL